MADSFVDDSQIKAPHPKRVRVEDSEVQGQSGSEIVDDVVNTSKSTPEACSPPPEPVDTAKLNAIEEPQIISNAIPGLGKLQEEDDAGQPTSEALAPDAPIDAGSRQTLEDGETPSV